jgi:hypothetical protein
MAAWQVQTMRVDIPPPDLGVGPVVAVPDGWEPLTAVRQGETVILLMRQPVGGLAVPVLDALTPNSLPAGSTPATIDVTGTGFDNTSTVQADGQARATFYIDTGHLQYTARPDLASSGETHQMTVAGDGGTSNPLTFTFT